VRSLFAQFKTARILVALLAGPAIVLPATQSLATATDTAEQRQAWKSTLTALRSGNTRAYQNASESLRTYRLWPFLEYEVLKRKLSKLSVSEVQSFDDQYPSIVAGRNLRKRYLSVLAGKGQWKDFLEIAGTLPLDTKNSCYRLRAQLHAGTDIKDIDDEIAGIWNHGKSLPDACDPLFSAWNKKGGMTTLRVFERIASAIKVGNPGLTNYLSRTWLNKADRRWADRWIAMRQKPLQELAREDWNGDPTVIKGLLRYGIRRAALRNLDSAEKKVSQWREKFNLETEDEAWLASKIGLAAATDFHPSAVRWLAQVPDLHSNASVREWRVRAALRERNYQQAGDFLLRLDAEERLSPKWQYWKARVLARDGQAEPAKTIYRELAATRNFYGFLAADLIGTDYVMNHSPIAEDDADLQRLAELDDLLVARELFISGETTMARRQWSYALGKLSSSDTQRTAILAHRWGWHDRAIITAGRSGYKDDIKVRFPLLHRDLVETHAKRQRLDPGWIYGVVRQESAFNPQARSSVGALGLMQLMPQTGRRVGRKLNLPIKSNKAILNVGNNITLGTAYLRMVLDRNRGHLALATASYNAGPHKVERWLPEVDSLDADIWIETIPYAETRNFVKNVLAFMAVYETRLGGEQPRLSQRLQAILPASEQTLVSQ